MLDSNTHKHTVEDTHFLFGRLFFIKRAIASGWSPTPSLRRALNVIGHRFSEYFSVFSWTSGSPMRWNYVKAVSLLLISLYYHFKERRDSTERNTFQEVLINIFPSNWCTLIKYQHFTNIQSRITIAVIKTSCYFNNRPILYYKLSVVQ